MERVQSSPDYYCKEITTYIGILSSVLPVCARHSRQGGGEWVEYGTKQTLSELHNE